MNIKKIALFASGSGTNAQNIIHYFAKSEQISIDSLWSNKPDAYALKRATAEGIDTFVFHRKQFYETTNVLEKLREREIDLIVLAGFLWLVPDNLIDFFSIVNIHPALLPKYGGKGMYGLRVHRAVVDNQESESGISIHFVNRNYDEGELIFQAKCTVLSEDAPEDVAKKVHELEYKYYPAVIEQLLLGKIK